MQTKLFWVRKVRRYKKFRPILEKFATLITLVAHGAQPQPTHLLCGFPRTNTANPKQKSIFWETKMTETISRVKAKKFTTVLLSALKGSKLCIAFLLGIWFAYEVYTAFGKLDNQTTFTSSSTVEVNFTYPSVTICVTMDSNFTGGPMNKDWQPFDKYNLTVPFDHLGYVSDRNERLSDFLSPNLNDVDNLKSLGYDVEDIWTYAIRGQMAEPFPCYTYQPKKQRTNGLSNHVSFFRNSPKIFLIN